MEHTHTSHGQTWAWTGEGCPECARGVPMDDGRMPAEGGAEGGARIATTPVCDQCGRQTDRLHLCNGRAYMPGQLGGQRR